MKLEQKEKDQILQNYIREWESKDKGMYKRGNDDGYKFGIFIGIISTLAFIVLSFIIFSL